jgi:hypothetical protein
MAKRTRTVFGTDEIPHLWAHGLEEGRKIRNGSSNIYAEGDTIYSYGPHFPIARRVTVPALVTVGTFNPAKGRRKTREVEGTRTVFLYTTRRYSNTTRGHCYAVAGAMRGNGPAFDIDPVDGGGRNLWDILTSRKGSAKPVAEWYQTRIRAAEAEARTPRRVKASTRLKHAEAAAVLLEEWRSLHEAFGIRLSVNTVTLKVTADSIRTEYAAALQREADAQARKDERERTANAERERKAAERRARLAGTLPAVIADYRKGGTGRVKIDGVEDFATIRDVGYPVLRLIRVPHTDTPGVPVTGETVYVETSYGARVDEEDARQALRILPRLIARMERAGVEVADDEGARIGAYGNVRANRNALRIGCHDIPWPEVSAFCAAYGWECPALPVSE